MSQLTVAESVLSTLMRGGWVLIPIFFVGWAGWLLSLERLWFFRTHKLPWTKLLDRVSAVEDPWDGVASFENDRGVLGRLCSGILRRRNGGVNSWHHWREQVEAEFRTPVERHLRTIQVLGASAPLLGLLGTVSGMVQTFTNITQFGFGNPVLMADGISESLLTTQAGLVVAFPLVLAGNSLRNRARRLTDHLHSSSLTLIARLQEVKA